MNGHAEEVVEKEPEKSEQAEHKGEESETNASAGTEVPLESWILLLTSAELFMTPVRDAQRAALNYSGWMFVYLVYLWLNC